MSYTPGPWEIVVVNDNWGRQIRSGGTFICDLCRPNPEADEEEKARAEGDARLIAAAPKLYELVCYMLNDEQELYQRMLEIDTPDEAEYYKEIIDEAQALLNWIDDGI